MKEEEFVVLVDENDKVLGKMEKQKAHIEGVLHRAFSIFIFNEKKEMLLQQRAKSKYHSPLKWTNACCSHPRENESYEDAAHRRLKEELGFDTDLDYVFKFIYKSDVGQGLTEHEYDYVFCGYYNQNINFNKEEVENIKWVELNKLKRLIKENPDEYTEWFKIIFDKYILQIAEFYS